MKSYCQRACHDWNLSDDGPVSLDLAFLEAMAESRLFISRCLSDRTVEATCNVIFT